MSESFDLAVLGAGPGGYVAAIRASQLGLRTVCIDKGPVGGTCLNRGCIPTKALLEASHTVALSQHAKQYGIEFAPPKIDFAKMIARKDQVVGRLVRGIESLFKMNNIERVKGSAKFTSPTEIEVTGEAGEKRTITAKKIIIATGSEPLNIPAFPFDGDKILSSTDVLNLQAQPATILIVGGGYIGCEFACFFAEVGTQVTVVEMMDRVLPLSDLDMSKETATALKKMKVKLTLNTKIESIEKAEGKVIATLSTGEKIEAEKALISIGRTINSNGIGLEAAGVKLGQRKEILINEHCQTNVPNIYAIGDVTAKMQLAHLASEMGIVAAEHAAGKDRAAINYDQVPASVFAHPEAASVGLTEEEAAKRGIDAKTFKFPIQVLGKAQALGETGFVKIIAEKSTGHVLGGHIVCSRAGDMIAEIAVAMKLESTVEELAHTIHVHPTLSEGVKEAAEGWMGQGIHFNG